MTSFQDLARQLHEKSKEFNEHLTGLVKLNDELRDRAGKVLTAITKRYINNQIMFGWFWKIDTMDSVIMM